MSLAKYKQTKIDLQDASKKVSELQALLRKQCPHNDIKEEWYVNDDWAQRKRYTVSYQCQFCGTHASFNEEDNELKSDTLLILEKNYRAQKERKWKAEMVKK
ncbi:hypothetical protein SDC9_46820 [bioreactor metagenome]|uniref:Uncharacterized protein n=1 Tax=bioreactor metagenome TaxID=1076179 RepID=A0A644WDE8_9ZZZZ